MYKAIFLSLVYSLIALSVAAQKAPSWAKKAAKSVCSLLTYDADGVLKNKGQGVFISDDGVCITDYKLLEDADSVVVITKDGKQYPVHYVAGCDDLYDLAKLKVEIKNSPFLPFAQAPAAVDEKVYVVLYSDAKNPVLKEATVKLVDNARDGDHYYTLQMPALRMAKSCPVVNAAGELIGLYQYTNNDEEAYACGVKMAANLSFDAFMFQNVLVSSIKLLKKLPDNENDAQVAMVMGRPSMDDATYLAYLDLYREQFPDSPYSYERMADYCLDKGRTDQAVDEIQDAFSRYQNEDEAYYAMAKFKYAAADSLAGTKGYSMNDAYEDVKMAIAVKPQPLYYQLRAQIEKALGDYDAALESYDVVLGSNMCSLAAINDYILINEMRGASLSSQVELVDTLRKTYADKLGADSTELLYVKALYLDRSGDYAKALQCLLAYSAAYDEQMTADFFYYREQVALKARRYQQAMNDINQAMKLVPDNLTYMVEYAGLCIIANDYDKAISILQQCHDRDAANQDINRLLGLALIQVGRNDEACTYLTAAKEAGDIVAERLCEQYCQ